MNRKLFFFFSLLFCVLFFGCNTNSNYVKPSDRNIKSVTITYDEKLNHFTFLEYNSFIDEYFIKMQEAYSIENFIELDVNEKYWKMLIDRIKKSKKFSAPFRAPRNPGLEIFSVSIKYQNGKETSVTIPQYSYYIINGIFYVPQEWDVSIIDVFEKIIADKNR